jgi:hypothetical protein
MPMTPEQTDELAALRRTVVRLIASLRNLDTSRMELLMAKWNEWNRGPETKLDHESLELLAWANASLRELNNRLVDIGGK